MSIEELESVVSGLPAAEPAKFSQPFEEFMADQWDRQIERDALSGRLDAALKRADNLYEAGRIDRLWIIEAKRRRDEVRQGLGKTIRGDEVLAEVRRSLGR